MNTSNISCGGELNSELNYYHTDLGGHGSLMIVASVCLYVCVSVCVCVCVCVCVHSGDIFFI